ncbi:hypothetical protein GQ602_001158 [Ophiocordyceps camponoti-floridani]|uniref:Uncharacterized protein n=1 Tax=Ophiocordyceps camponoti-floridani TaxID=2030778 RepID=A0A8H4VH50_9HYPO|nr:hypothetical protein GQ602_001158 [Ophiocordyceps camponoti-floridani]
MKVVKNADIPRHLELAIVSGFGLLQLQAYAPPTLLLRPSLSGGFQRLTNLSLASETLRPIAFISLFPFNSIWTLSQNSQTLLHSLARLSHTPNQANVSFLGTSI